MIKPSISSTSSKVAPEGSIINQSSSSSGSVRRVTKLNKEDVEERWLRQYDREPLSHTSKRAAFGVIISEWTNPSAYALFLRFARGEIKKRPLGFCVGSVACFLVVVVLAVMLSTLDTMPAIFLSLAEQEHGQRDMVLRGPSNHPAPLLNYRTMSDALEPLGDAFSYHAPRFVASERTLYSKCPPTVSASVPLSTAALYVPFDTSGPIPPTPSSTLDLTSRYLDILTNFDATEKRLEALCASALPISLVASDTTREKRMGLGQRWPLPALSRGHAAISSSTAAFLDVVVGDTVVIDLAADVLLRQAFLNANLSRGVSESGASTYADAPIDLRAMVCAADSSLCDSSAIPTSLFSQVVVPFTVEYIVSETFGKAPSSASDHVFVEFDSFVAHVADFLRSPSPGAPMVPGTTWPTGVPALAREAFARTDPTLAVNEVSLNLPPPRYSIYASSDYNSIQDRFVTLGSKAMHRIGMGHVRVEAGILEYLFISRFFTIFINLLISIITATLMYLAVILIYSLLMTNVETRQFEVGVQRMVGLSKTSVVQLILINALALAVPGLIAGLIIGQFIFIGIAIALRAVLVVDVAKNLAPLSVVAAILLGLLIPLLASVLPIMDALETSLASALDTSRSKTAAVEYKIERNEDRIAWRPVIFGVVGAALAFMCVYLFPLSLIHQNLSLLFGMFFIILMCLLLGLIALALNFQGPLESAIAVAFFGWWESSTVVTILKKNLTAHRRRNRKSMVMFASALAFILFISTLATANISALSANIYSSNAMRVSFQERYANAQWDPLAAVYPDRVLYGDTVVAVEEALTTLLARGLVREWVWLTPRAARGGGGVGSTTALTVGRIVSRGVHVYGVPPRFTAATSRAFDSDYTTLWRKSSDVTMSYTEDSVFTRSVVSAGTGGLSATAALYLPTSDARAIMSANWGVKLGGGDDLEAGRFMLRVQPSSGVVIETRPSVLAAASTAAANDREDIQTTATFDRSSRYFVLGYTAFASSLPALQVSRFGEAGNDVAVSVPSYMAIAGAVLLPPQSVDIVSNASIRTSLREAFDLRPRSWRLTPYQRLFVDIPMGAPSSDVAKVRAAVEAAVVASGYRVNSIRFTDVKSSLDPLQLALSVLEYFFAGSSVVAMAMCFFALAGTMSTNILEQAKEIAILRAIGMRAHTLLAPIRRVYVWEAFTIIITSSFTGGLIGALVAWTMTMQLVLFTQLAIPFSFPWVLLGSIVAAGVVFAFVSSYGPIRMFAKGNIVVLLRRLVT